MLLVASGHLLDGEEVTSSCEVAMVLVQVGLVVVVAWVLVLVGRLCVQLCVVAFGNEGCDVL